MLINVPACVVLPDEAGRACRGGRGARRRTGCTRCPGARACPRRASTSRSGASSSPRRVRHDCCAGPAAAHSSSWLGLLRMGLCVTPGCAARLWWHRQGHPCLMSTALPCLALGGPAQCRRCSVRLLSSGNCLDLLLLLTY